MIDLEEHLSHNYIVKIKEVNGIRGLVVTFPKNIILGLEENTFIYEIDGDDINVFCDGVKVEVIKCMEYASRFMIASDISAKMSKRMINSQFIALYSSSGELLEKGNVKIINVIMGSDNSRTCDLESELEQSLRRYSVNGDIDEVSESVIEGFDLISNRYIEGTNNE